MEFLNLTRLKQTLSQGPLPPAEAVKYVAAQAMLYSIVLVPTPYEQEPEAWTYVLSLIVTGLGVFYCYRSNGGATGDRFVERYLAVGWVVGWRVGLTAALLSCGAVALLVLAGPVSFAEWTENQGASPAWIALGHGLIALVYWRTGIRGCPVAC